MQLEDISVISQSKVSSQTYVKQQLGVKPNETKMLGIHCGKEKEVIIISFPANKNETKRGILKFLA